MDTRAHTLRGIAVQARVIACSPWPELEAAMPGGDGMQYYPLALLVKLLRNITAAANA